MIKALQSFTGRAARRLRGIRRRATSARKALRRAAVLGCLTASMLGGSQVAWGQMGQAPMAASGGLANRAIQGLSDINLNGQGRLYYGINAADRGLGYRGSYMTLGGYFPTVEDDLGGLWAADVRSHLSNYGGFFSNIGAVRKQMLGSGSLLGVGVFWDYDGDQNQYADTVVGGPIDPIVVPGGFSYNQVGVSGELLTDWGNLRSNGYIPLGSTGQSTGRFVSTNILCQQGINAALGGADLEVGAYLPGLADWAGMINVGGYAYGNTRYQLDTGAELVPWFGGVYTRIDLTFADNWDFSLQYNNDSYFNSTGFARLTYRLGGSRRRNVPDQINQPMMRNEHIVRAHQEAVVARNPFTGAAWRIIHVDNAAPATGTGSAQTPFSSLTAAEAEASNDYDIVFVHNSSTPYANSGGDLFTFQADNQYLVGEGSAQTIPTMNCGAIPVSTTIAPSLYPTLSPRPGDTAVLIETARSSETVTGFTITSSGIGLESRSGSGVNSFTDLAIQGGTTGINIAATSGASYDITNVSLASQTTTGLENDGTGAIALTNATFTDTAGTAIRTTAGAISAGNITINNANGTGITVDGTNQAILSLSNSAITNATTGLLSDGDGVISIDTTSITNGNYGIRASGSATGSIAATNSLLNGDDPTTGLVTEEFVDGILIEGDTAVTLGSSAPSSANETRIRNAENGVRLTGNGSLSMFGGSLSNISETGIVLRPLAPAVPEDGSASLRGVSLLNIGLNGIDTEGVAEQGGTVSFIDSTMSTIAGVGIVASGIGNTTAGSGGLVNVQNSKFTSTGSGIEVTNSNLRVEDSMLTSVGSVGISSADASTVLINNTRITGDTTAGIQATAADDLSYSGGAATGRFNNLTVTNSTITTTATGIELQGAVVTDPVVTTQIDTQGIVRANISRNVVTTQTATNTTTGAGGGFGGGTTAATTTSNQITLNTVGGVVGAAGPPATAPALTGGLITSNGRPQGILIRASSRTNLEIINDGATVTETPTPADPESTTTAVEYNLTTTVATPPAN